MATYLGALDTTGSPVFVPGVDMVVRDDLSLHTSGFAPVVEVRATETVFQHVPIDDVVLRDEHLKEKTAVEMGRRGADPDATRLYVVVDRAATGERVQSVLSSAYRAGFVHPVLVFARTPSQKRPPPSKIDKQLEAILAPHDRTHRATELAKLATDVIATCPDMMKLFGQVASSDQGSKGKLIVQGAPTALLACECAADPASVRNLLAAFIVDDPIALLPVQLAPDGASLDPAKPWSELGTALQPGATLRLP